MLIRFPSFFFWSLNTRRETKNNKWNKKNRSWYKTAKFKTGRSEKIHCRGNGNVWGEAKPRVVMIGNSENSNVHNTWTKPQFYWRRRARKREENKIVCWAPLWTSECYGMTSEWGTREKHAFLCWFAINTRVLANGTHTRVRFCSGPFRQQNVRESVRAGLRKGRERTRGS